jgi:hypothetical protein
MGEYSQNIGRDGEQAWLSPEADTSTTDKGASRQPDRAKQVRRGIKQAHEQHYCRRK